MLEASDLSRRQAQLSFLEQEGHDDIDNNHHESHEACSLYHSIEILSKRFSVSISFGQEAQNIKAEEQKADCKRNEATFVGEQRPSSDLVAVEESKWQFGRKKPHGEHDNQTFLT